MIKKIEYKDAETFMFACVQHEVLPAFHWRDGDDNRKGFIWFTPFKNFVFKKGEVHLFYSSNKKTLDAIWNSIGLIKRAVKLVDEVKEK